MCFERSVTAGLSHILLPSRHQQGRYRDTAQQASPDDEPGKAQMGLDPDQPGRLSGEIWI
jgi:hypothetical protein